jgi:serine/threonine protein kinase
MATDPKRVQAVFLAAAQAADRADFLNRECSDNAELRRLVEALLRDRDQVDSSPEQPDAPPGPTVDSPPAPQPRGLSEAVGSVIGPYKLLQQLGEGGMGTVFLGEQEQPVKRRVALKIIKPGMDSAHVLARFEAERQALALMDHPNIARVLDAGATDGGRPYFVMELVKGVPITRYCDQENLSPRERLELFVPVCQAVQHAHQKGIIHRDLKPSNVLVALYDGRPVAKVIDFGVAKATAQKLTERTLFTEVGQIVGTLEYMAPEQAELNNLDIDTRADIYSLGVLLYELLTGSPPFTSRQLRGVAFTEMLRLIREVEPHKPSTRLSSSEELPAIAARRKLEPKKLTKLVHGELDWIVMKCLEKERGRRYETANALGVEIQRYLADEPVLAGPPSSAYRLRKFLRRHRGRVLAILTLLLVLFVGAVVSTWEALRATEAEKQAREEARKAREAEKVADEQRRVTEAVNEFWEQNVLAQANPWAEGRLEMAPDKDIKLRTVLDRAAAQIPGRFASQPVIEASVRREVGNAYLGLGEYDLALPHLEAAYEIRRRTLGEDHPDTLAAVQHLMRPYIAKGQIARTEPFVMKVLEARRRTLGPRHPDTLKAESDLAVMYELLGQHARAEGLHRQVLETRRQELGAEHPDTLMAQIKVAAVCMNTGKVAEAETLLVETLATAQKTLAPDHPCTMDAQHYLASVYQQQGQHAKAEPLRLQILESYRRKWGPNHLNTRRYEVNLANYYTGQGQHAKAEPLLVRALDDYRARFGEDNPDTMRLQSSLAGLYRMQGQFAKAEPLLVTVVEVQRRKVGDESLETNINMNDLANLYTGQGQHDRAIPWYKVLLEIRRKQGGADDTLAQIYCSRLAFSYEALGDYARAEPFWRELLAGRRRQPGTEPLLVADTLSRLALNLTRQDNPAGAEPVLRECLAIRTQKQPDAWMAFHTRLQLGAALLAQKKYADAEPLLVQGYEGIKAREAKLPPDRKARLAEALGLLVRLYDGWGKKEEAAKWKKEQEAMKKQ